MSVVLAVYYRHYSDACLICGAVRPAVCPYLVDLLGPKGHWHCLGRCEVVVWGAVRSGSGVPLRVLPCRKVSPGRAQLGCLTLIGPVTTSGIALSEIGRAMVVLREGVDQVDRVAVLGLVWPQDLLRILPKQNLRKVSQRVWRAKCCSVGSLRTVLVVCLARPTLMRRIGSPELLCYRAQC
jgi:hypothetical protein